MKKLGIFLFGFLLMSNSYSQSTFLNCIVSGEMKNVNNLVFTERKLDQSVVYVEVIKKQNNKIFIKIEGSDDFSNRHTNENLLTLNKNESDERNFNWVYEWVQDTGFSFHNVIKINRVNGFIRVYFNSRSPNDKYISTREYTGVCTEISNKNKF
jgi:hypothetical protein